MDTKIQSVNFDADKELVLFVEERVGKLGQYFDNIVGVESFLKVEKSDSHENKIAEIFAKKKNVTNISNFDERTLQKILIDKLSTIFLLSFKPIFVLPLTYFIAAIVLPFSIKCKIGSVSIFLLLMYIHYLNLIFLSHFQFS